MNDVIKVLREHKDVPAGEEDDICVRCDQLWPCDAARALDALVRPCPKCKGSRVVTRSTETATSMGTCDLCTDGEVTVFDELVAWRSGDVFRARALKGAFDVKA